ncbi:MAG TPA: hypothetical protein PLU15_10280 [Bacillota bacterium]|nr:hypothetical protein [Bacillota bacterium]HOO31334.1 hypothetical protein [Bacillota bacterium]
MEIHDIGGHRLTLAELGQDDCAGVLDRRAHVVYNAPPNPDTINWWRGYKQVSYTYQDFLDALFALYDQADADEYYIETGKVHDSVVDHLRGRGLYIQERPILYSAPLNGHGLGMAKRRIPCTLVVASRQPVPLPAGEYSHETIADALSRRQPGETVFDPCIGKGLALRAAIARGMRCVGIESSPERLKCCIEYATREAERC